MNVDSQASGPKAGLYKLKTRVVVTEVALVKRGFLQLCDRKNMINDRYLPCGKRKKNESSMADNYSFYRRTIHEITILQTGSNYSGLLMFPAHAQRHTVIANGGLAMLDIGLVCSKIQ